MYELYEPAGDDEINTINVTITEDMSPDDVIQKVNEKLKNHFVLKKTPWHNGYWYNKNQRGYLSYIHGENIETKSMVCLDYPYTKSYMRGKVTYGNFGPAHSEIVKATGTKNYNMEYDIDLIGKIPGVINEEGTQIHAKGLLPNQIDVSNWLCQEELEKLKEDREPADAPSSPYKPQPDNLGKLLWFSGIF